MKEIGPYLIREELARGGMGVVYRAYDPRMSREVAIKLLLTAELTEGEERERFEREALSLARLRHPGIVSVHDLGWERGKPYLVMDLVEGEPLDVLLKRGPLEQREAARLVAQLARALSVAHAEGVIHRDMKPANAFRRPDGGVSIIDFGLAKSIDGAQGLTKTGAILGTPAYAAPEQARGAPGETGPWTDVYGLGATLFELLTGAKPFDGSSVLAVLAQVIEDPPPAPRSLRSDLDPALEAICLTCLEKEPLRRFPSCEALAQALEGYLSAEAAGRGAGRRLPLALAGLGALAIAGVVAAIVAAVGARPPTPSLENRAPGERGAGGEEHGAAPKEPTPKAAAEAARAAAAGARDLASGRYGEAERHFEEALRRDPGQREASLGMATIREKLTDLRGALGILDALREDADVLPRKAELLASLGEGDKALAACERLFALVGEVDARAYLARGRVYRAQGRLGPAGDDAEQARRLSDHADQRVNAQARALTAGRHLDLFLAKSRQGSPPTDWMHELEQGAVKEARKAVEEDPLCLEALRTFAWVEVAAAEASEKAGEAELVTLHLERAYKVFDSAVGRQTRNPELLAYRGYLHLLRGRLGEARTDIERALELWADYPVALGNRARLHLREGGDRAAEAARHALARAEERCGGRTLFLEGMYSEVAAFEASQR